MNGVSLRGLCLANLHPNNNMEVFVGRVCNPPKPVVPVGRQATSLTYMGLHKRSIGGNWRNTSQASGRQENRFCPVSVQYSFLSQKQFADLDEVEHTF